MTDYSLTEFLDALGSSAATPGGGAGAAVALGMGAALVAMTARLTTGRRRFRAVQADMERVIERCDAIRDSALELAEADAEAYGNVMAAFGLPRGSASERSSRRAAIASASEQASRVPLRVAAAASEVIELAAETAVKGNPNVISDAGAGAALARTAIRICEMNVQANLGSINGSAVREELTAALDRALAARDAADGVVDGVLGNGSA
ncbi:MAG: cyclodeaminase/cyclohydrolase family protein [Chloroflexota bacterium]|nr:cyclodeaminase/cyclohydrolase family protein [Chloroflexota bacterium]MDE2920732.1 cyclodeaminase/cyclohydrolase family protein [Chloroflexota bacterium]